MIYLAALLFLAVAFVTYKAHAWNYKPVLFAAQQRERSQSSQLQQILLRFFDALDTTGTGLLTRKHLLAVGELSATDAEKTLIRQALCHAEPRVYTAENPWFLAPEHSYTFTAIGHVIGKRKETRVAAAGVGMHGAVAYNYEVVVDDYGISKADLETYAARVSARPSLAKF